VGCPGEDRVEPESIQGAPNMVTLKGETAAGNAENLLERILDPINLGWAVDKVVSNKGAPGIDGMTVEELRSYIKDQRKELVDSILNGEYEPQPVRRKEIPKDGGKGVRKLGIPTVIDRMVQQAVAQELGLIFEKKFSNFSYAFRPGIGAFDAIIQVHAYYKDGYKWAVDMDLAQYFDTVNHDILIKMLREDIKDERVIALIRKFLKSGILNAETYERTDVGVPQGGNLSPLLSNIYLTALDNELQRRGHKFVRYADDCNIYVKSKRAAERVLGSIRSYLKDKLKLTVNEEKTKIGSPLKLKFLGFSLWKIGKKDGIRVHEKSMKKFQEKVKKLTKRNRGCSIKTVLSELRKYTAGWLGYFSLANLASKMPKLDGWIRARLRMYIWKQWKRVRTRFKKLQQLGLSKLEAWMFANTRKGYWRIAHSPILTKTLTNKHLKELGYQEMTTYYEKLWKKREEVGTFKY
jgi:group II intron reverse transcriptase/maturase